MTNLYLPTENDSTEIDTFYTTLQPFSKQSKQVKQAYIQRIQK